ncbi:hypothetical protein CPB83DRAFT_412633 [Crepidotus variabilis]|uniref:Secreted protein n=1 Tax=Crepidotus variabilis TaxID=179855 RepID=A0A9P6JVG0_9AGAR|nr:hypothetical protein CPB83DRAFT_412633 [Crepidotus variabilis]
MVAGFLRAYFFVFFFSPGAKSEGYTSRRASNSAKFKVNRKCQVKLCTINILRTTPQALVGYLKLFFSFSPLFASWLTNSSFLVKDEVKTDQCLLGCLNVDSEGRTVLPTASIMHQSWSDKLSHRLSFFN